MSEEAQGTQSDQPTPADERSRRVVEILAEFDEIEIEIEKLVEGAQGFARYRGVPVFVPLAAPGDHLRVRLTDRRSHYGRAEIVEVLEPGAGRRDPPCRYFERCGGCDLQHLEDDLQVDLKVAAARETLERLGKLQLPERQRVERAEPWGYRTRTQLQIEPGEESSAVGYFARGTHELVAVDRCPVLVPELEEVLASLPERLAGVESRRLDLAAGSTPAGVWSAAPVVADLPHGEIRTEVGEFVYCFDARTFFQGHRGLLTSLVDAVVGEDEGALAVDLFAGVGLFSIPLARGFEKVAAVEGDRVAARYLRKNARLNKVSNVEVEAMAVQSWLSRLPESVDLVVVDPPRTGLALGARGVLLTKRPRRLTYVSCHAATLARDLRGLANLYRLDELVFFDLFPQTAHLEIVARLSRRDASV